MLLDVKRNTYTSILTVNVNYIFYLKGQCHKSPVWVLQTSKHLGVMCNTFFSAATICRNVFYISFTWRKIGETEHWPPSKSLWGFVLSDQSVIQLPGASQTAVYIFVDFQAWIRGSVNVEFSFRFYYWQILKYLIGVCRQFGSGYLLSKSAKICMCLAHFLNYSTSQNIIWTHKRRNAETIAIDRPNQ